MTESQNVEYKRIWKDEYLRWICGFANANGGVIYIGVDDSGQVVGLKNIDKLLNDIPNKIQSGLGLVVDVNKLTKDGLDYIEIKVEPVGYPINYHGEYHYRSGNTKQQLCGIALTEFIRKKTGPLWEAVPMENISVDDLDLESIRIFKREAIRKGRMSEEDLNMPTNELMKHLGLLVDGKLTRAAVLLFYRYPQRYFVGSHVKVGKFATEADLLYHDDIEGSLFVIADRVIDLIFTKYLKAKITYDHAVRVETFPFPYEGVREAVFNAIVHNNYSSGVPIQIKILDDYMYVSNEHLLPWDWTAERLINSHVSKPLNQSIANAFYRAGHIETWGRGIQIIEESCRKLGMPFPEYEILGSGIRVKFQALESAKITETKGQERKGTVICLSKDEKLLLEAIKKAPDATQDVYAKRLEFSLPKIKYLINKLIRNQVIVRNGSKKVGFWEINDNEL